MTYHGLAAVSRSFLVDYDEDPQLAVDKYIHQTVEDSPSPVMQFGNDVEAYLWRRDTMIVPPEDLIAEAKQDCLDIPPTLRRNSKAFDAWAAERAHLGKPMVRPGSERNMWDAGGWRHPETGSPIWKQWLADNKGKTIIDKDDERIYKQIVANIAAHEDASLLATPQDLFYVITVNHPTYGFPCKCEIDNLRPNCFVDLKTSHVVNNAQKCANHFYNMGYHRQIAWYQDLLRWSEGAILPGDNLVVRNKPSYGVACYRLDENFVKIGREQNERTCQQIDAMLQKAGGWPKRREDWPIARPSHHNHTVKLSAPKHAEYWDQWAV